MKHGYIYKITIGPKFYFGQTRNRNQRKSAHKRALENGSHTNQYMQRAYDKYGKFRFEIVERVQLGNLSSAEARYISDFFDNPDCMNLVYGDPSSDFVQSEETRNKKSLASRGKKHTDATKQKISKALKGRTLSAESRKKISESKKGKRLTPEHNFKKSKGQRGKKRSRKALQSIRKKMEVALGKPCVLISPDGRKYEFESVTAAAEHIGECRQNLGKRLRGEMPWPKRGRTAGWTGYVVTR